MKISEAEVLVRARSLAVWDVLTDTSNVTVWDSGIVAIRGEIRDGGTIRIRTIGRRRSSRFRVRQNPGRFMHWRGGWPLGLLRRTLTVALTPVDAGTRLRITYTLGGLLLPLARIFPRPSDGAFASFVEAVRTRAELLDRHTWPSRSEKALSAN